MVQTGRLGGGSGGNNGISAIIKNKVISILKNNKKCADFIGGDAAGQLKQTDVIYSNELGGWNIDENGVPKIKVEQADKGKININSKGPFDNPTKPVTVNGSTFVPLDAFNEEYNTSFSSIEYQELWLIHSLAHITMAKEFKDEQSYGDVQTNNEKIISNCFAK